MTEEKKVFKAELRQLMDLIIHSLYSHREIFLRELLSNACDAINRLRFQAIQKPELTGDDTEWSIRVTADKQKGQLIISDNGKGMTRQELDENLGTIAKSGTKTFLQQLKDQDVKDRPELIGQFGVGFYSAFMVADQVTVVSRAAGETAAAKWICSGGEGYAIEDAEKAGRGTEITLHLRDDAKEFLDEWRIREIVKKYSDFIEYPVSLELVDEKGNAPAVTNPVMNAMKALWIRPKAELKEEEYNEFYKAVSHDFQNPARVIHYSAEGTLEFRALLFLPAHRPLDFFFGDTKTGPALYIQRVQIMDHCDKLLPNYLRFVKGVVDSSDLPLNVSREMLQHNAVLAKIQKNLVGKVLSELAEMKSRQYEEYVKFYREFGDVLKEGAHEDFANREKIADLLLFHSTTASTDEQFVTLEKYLSTMSADQKEIYYLCGEHLGALASSPYVEAFKAKGQEVLLLTSPVDEWMIEALHEYKEKPFKPVDRGEAPAGDDEKKAMEAHRERFASLLQYLKGKLPTLKEVRISARLKNSASCLVVDEQGMSAQMERIMRKMGQAVPPPERILELNPAHPAVKNMLELYEKDRANERIELYGRLFYDEAVLAEGSRVEDPVAFAERINALMIQPSA